MAGERSPRHPGRAAARLALAVLLFAAPAAAQDFTLEDILSAPFPGPIVATPDGRLAWVRNDQGERNIWVAAPPELRGRQLTFYQGDDGVELGDLAFAGGRLLYVRGGAPNRQGEIPNPRTLPEPPERWIWTVPFDGGEPVRLVEAGGLEVDPAGERIAYVSDGAIHVLRLEVGSGEVGDTAEKVVEPRGGARSLAWSPDGTRLAFVSSRGDHAFIGIYDLEADELRYLDPSMDHDGSPAWSPHGRRLAFLRVPNRRNALPFSPQREAHPWSIRVADLETGAVREVFRAEEGPGSVFRSVGADNQILWAAGDRLVFPWERTGWIHMWSVPATGGQPTDLTPGEHEVQYVALTPGRSRIVYDSNTGDIDRKHLWNVDVAGGSPRRQTGGSGIEWGPAPFEGGLAFLAAGARTPAHAEVLVDGERRPLVDGWLPASFPADRLVEPRQVVFPATDGLEIHGQLFLPRGLEPGERRPAVMFFHGGSRRQMLLGFHHRGYYHNTYAFNQYLASLGYVVLSVNYRSGIGYGMEFREALDYGARGASEFRDVVGGAEYLRGRADVDPDRIGLWGGSYGGYLTALGLARRSDLFAAGVDLHGVHDWNVVIRNFVPEYEPEKREEVARLAYESSPMADIGSWRSPVLLIHGDDDRNVPFSESVDLAEALREQGVHFEQLVFPDEVHGFLLHEHWLEAFRAAADFLDRTLGNR